MATVSPAARELLNDADYAAMLVTLGAASAASPTFTGTVTVPTPGAGDSTTKAASTAFLKAPGPIGSVTPNTGGFTTLSASGAFTPSQTAGIVGTTTVNNANAGSIGEHITASVASTAITTGVAANTASIVLTPGDWEVSGSIQFVPTGVPTSFAGGISTTSAALPAGGQLSTNFYGMTLASGTAWSFPVPTQRINVASNTTVYLVGQSGFGGTAVTNATIRARRVR